jgi:alpha-1,2-mannosyltransferase
MSPLQKPLLLLCAVFLAAQAGVDLFHELSNGTRFGGDFVSFWNAAHRVRHGDIAAIYDPDAWQRILSNTTGFISLSWFVYPPFTLFGLWPLGDATYNEAVLVWSLVPLAFYFALIALLAKRSGLGLDANLACDSWSRAQAYAVLIAFSLPFVGANLFCGQTGTLVSVFFLGTAYFWPTRPIPAGICIGLLAIKPQMGLLMPFAL